MDNRVLRALAERLAVQLPELPDPWNVDEFCERLAHQRGRQLTLRAVDASAFPSGMWFDDGTQDFIFIHAATASSNHRDHVVLHEVCHMLAGHGRPRAELSAERPSPRDVDQLAPQAVRSGAAHTDIEEELAECFATLVLMRSRSLRRRDNTATERRAIDIFGASSG